VVAKEDEALVGIRIGAEERRGLGSQGDPAECAGERDYRTEHAHDGAKAEAPLGE
jgi:hypothetical protein